MVYNSVQAYLETKDFEQFLLIKWKIINEFQNWIKDVLLEKLESVYKNWSDFAKSGELTLILLQWRKMLKTW